MVHITVSHCTLPYYDWATELHRMTDVLVLLSQEKLHKLEHALVDSKDDKAAEKAEAERQRDREAEEKLKYLQCKFLCVCVCVCVSHRGRGDRVRTYGRLRKECCFLAFASGTAVHI